MKWGENKRDGTENINKRHPSIPTTLNPSIDDSQAKWKTRFFGKFEKSGDEVIARDSLQLIINHSTTITISRSHLLPCCW